VKHLALISGLCWMGGCFYVPPINQRPALDIKPRSSDSIHRGQKAVLLDAIANDPEGQFVTFQWRVYLCTDAAAFETCDQEPFTTGLDDFLSIDVPLVRADPDGDGPAIARPVESMLVKLEAKDDHGATAKPADELVIPVLDADPTLVVDQTALYGGVTGTPIDLFAVYGDPDDTAANVTVTWQAFSPSQVEINLTDIVVAQPEDVALIQVGKRLVPNATGLWDIKITATDPVGQAVIEHLSVPVGDDKPPCLTQWSPIAPTGGVTLPITEPTLFQVPLVSDDLDRFPTIVGDPFLGPTTFAWSIKPPGAAAREPLVGVTGNSVALDPASFAPGSIVELRVEIFDRNAIPITCADGDQTCSVISTACIQRQTWRVEVR
jgi:hypothetical protein